MMFASVLMARGAVVSVAGVVINGNDRASGVQVKLVAVRGESGALATDTTTERGVYNLITPVVSDTVHSLWVILDDPKYPISKPVEVRLGAEVNGIRIARADDLQIILLNSALSKQDAVSAAVALQETVAIKLQAGLLTEPAATRTLSDGLGKILARVPGRDQDGELVRSVVQQAHKQLRRNLLPQPFLTDKQLLEMAARRRAEQRS